MTLSQVLYLFGIGYFIANLRVVVDLVRFRRRNRQALLTWPSPPPPFYRLNLAIGVALGVLIAVRLVVQRRPPVELFGETMMFLYYGYAMPLSTRIAKGFYRDGIWADAGFMRWGQIAAVSWREDRGVTLVLISRARQMARTLRVPPDLYGEARRLLRDRVKADDLHPSGGLGLGSREERDAV